MLWTLIVCCFASNITPKTLNFIFCFGNARNNPYKVLLCDIVPMFFLWVKSIFELTVVFSCVDSSTMFFFFVVFFREARYKLTFGAQTAGWFKTSTSKRRVQNARRTSHLGMELLMPQRWVFLRLGAAVGNQILNVGACWPTPPKKN